MLSTKTAHLSEKSLHNYAVGVLMVAITQDPDGQLEWHGMRSKEPSVKL